MREAPELTGKQRGNSKGSCGSGSREAGATSERRMRRMTAAQVYAANQDRADRDDAERRKAVERLQHNFDVFVEAMAILSIAGALGWIIVPALIACFGR
jgi:hypothetical protein